MGSRVIVLGFAGSGIDIIRLRTGRNRLERREIHVSTKISLEEMVVSGKEISGDERTLACEVEDQNDGKPYLDATVSRFRAELEPNVV
jgi:hypothetical protein